jgi:hypothetical protein
VVQDAADIVFMYKELEAYLRAEDLEEVARWDTDSWCRRRSGKTGANYVREAFVFQWHALWTEGGIAGLDDVYDSEIARVQRRMAECVLGLRGGCAVDSGYRAYLTDVEVACVVNIRCSDYVRPREVHQDEGFGLLETLVTSAEHAKVGGQNPIPAWVESVDEGDVLDPNAYEPCCYGDTAIHTLHEYRCEVEQDYDPATSCHAQHPLQFLLPLEFEQIWACRTTGDDGEINTSTYSRSQTILQDCDRYAMVSNNLFVLVDSSRDATYDRFSDPNGPLLAPGLKWHSKYDIEDNRKPGHLLLSYENLAPRCVHGLLHPLFEDYCMTCFPDWKHDDCVECKEYSVLNL